MGQETEDEEADGAKGVESVRGESALVVVVHGPDHFKRHRED